MEMLSPQHLSKVRELRPHRAQPGPNATAAWTMCPSCEKPHKVDPGMVVLRAQEAAELLGVGKTTVYQLAKQGIIPCFYVGGCVRFRLSELDAWSRSGGTRGSTIARLEGAR